jgi:hypothetical protein
MISLSANEVERRFGILGIPNRFSQIEKEELSTIDIVPRAENIIVFPTPEANKGLNLLQLRTLLGTNSSKQPSLFDHPWYLTEPFAEQDCAPGWHCLYTDVLADSISRSVNYANSLKMRGLELPTAIEVTLMLFLHYAETNEQLLHKKHTWCKDRASMNRWVTVGAFGRNGLFVSGHPPDFASRGLGICAKITR